MGQADDVDVVVVGSGGAGLCAALTASTAGNRVLILEKSELLGGTTALSGGGTWIPCHPHQERLGILDSREEALTYLRACAPPGWHNAEDDLWVAFVDNAGPMITFLEQHSRLVFGPCSEPDPYAEAPGGKAFGRSLSPRPLSRHLLGKWKNKLRGPQFTPWLNYEELLDTNVFVTPKRALLRLGPRMLYRALTGKRVTGSALVVGLLRACLDAGCEVWNNARACHLVKDNGRVVAVKVEHKGRQITQRVRKGVILACGGFEWNKSMMAKYFPDYPVEWTSSPSTNTGDGQTMAEAVGAKMDRMDQALIYGSTPEPYEGRVRGVPSGDYNLPHTMIVGRHARRFMNEKLCTDRTPMLERDTVTGAPLHLPAWRIYDSQFAHKYPHVLPKGDADNPLLRANTLQELALKIGLDGHVLADTAARFNTFARNGLDEDFQRGSSIWDRRRAADRRHGPNPALGTIERPAFFAFPFKASFIATKGGPRTNAKGQVIDRDAQVIGGLYAAGNVMANSIGTKGMGGGTTLGPVLTWGYICGLNVAAESLG